MPNNLAVQYNGYMGDGVYNQEMPPFEGTSLRGTVTVTDRPWSCRPLLSSETATLAPRSTQYAVLDAPDADIYYGPLQAPRYGDHSAAKLMPQVNEFAQQPGRADFGDTLDYPTNITSASVSSESPFEPPTRGMPLHAESSFNEFAAQLPAPRSPCLHSVPAEFYQCRIPYDTPMSSFDLAASQNSLRAAMPQAVRRPLQADILNSHVRSDGRTHAAVVHCPFHSGSCQASTVAPRSRLRATQNNRKRCYDQELRPREVASEPLPTPSVIVKEGIRYQPARQTKNSWEAWAEALGCSLEDICPIYSGRWGPLQNSGLQRI